MNGYELSRKWFDWCFENPERISPNHTALYFFIIEHCNRLGWKAKFGLPTTMVKEAIGIRSYNTYINTLNDLVDFGFVVMIEKSKNQYSSNIVALSNFDKAHDKALDKALIKHTTKQCESNSSIVKQETINKEQVHPLVIYLNTNCKQVQGLASPINNLDAERLLVEFDKHDLVEVFMAMENTKDLKKKYNSANLTVRSWIKTRQKNNSTFGQIKQQDKFKAAWQ
jgi:hypothetical protein